jgi:probable phosphoglycerate mutase
MTQKVYRQHRFTRPPGATEVLLVRHGESAPVVPGVAIPQVDGQDDPDLAPQGRAQAERVGARLATAGIDAVYATTLRRTHQTAAPLLAATGLTAAVEPDLREIHLGEWEGGLFRRHMTDGDPVARSVMTEQRWDVIPGAETMPAFEARLTAGLDRIVSAHPDQRVAVFSHGGAIGMVMHLAVGGGRPFAFIGVDNGSISHLVAHDGSWMIRGFNDVSHLAGLEDEVDLDPEPDPIHS